MLRLVLVITLATTAAWAQPDTMVPPEPDPTPTPRTPNPITPPEREAVWLFEEAQRLHRQGAPARAIELYRRALVQDPGRLEYRPYLGLALDQTGSPREALEQYNQYLKLEPEDQRVQLLRAAAWLHADDLVQARTALDRLTLSGSGNAYVHNLKGLLLLRVGQPAAAVTEFQAALAAMPGMAAARLNLSAAYLQSGQLDAARAELATILAKAPADAQALNNLAVAQARGQDLAAARTTLEQVPALAAGNLERYAPELAHDLTQASLNLATVLAREGLDKEALLVLAQLLDNQPQLLEAHLLNARLLTRQKRYEEARKDIDVVLAAGPGSPLWSYANEVSGLIFLAQGQDEAARVELDKAVKADPQRASAHHNYSMALGRTGQLVAAIDEEKKAMALAGDVPAMWYHLGVLYDLDARPNDAIEAYKKYLGLGGLDPEAAAALKEHVAELQDRISGRPGKPP